MSDREIRIKAEPLIADPNSCRFTVSEAVHRGVPVFFRTRDAAAGSPLPEQVFALDGVETVHVSDAIVTVAKRADADWKDLMKPIGALIRAQLLSGEPAVQVRGGGFGKRPETDDEIHAAVQQVLDDGINPFVAEHGGAITIDRVQDAVLYLRMAGGCQGCSSASATLRQGVEVLIAEEVPEVKQIVDLTDHSSGESPYL